MRYTAWLPVYASAKFECDIDPEGKTEKEIKDEFIMSAYAVGSICHQCSNEIESEFCLNTDIKDEDIELEQED